MRNLAPILLATFALSSCEDYNPEWKGWVYPNGGDLARSIALGRFSSLDECRRTSQLLLQNFHLIDENGDRMGGDYECGFQCRSDSDLGGLNVCKETSR